MGRRYRGERKKRRWNPRNQWKSKVGPLPAHNKSREKKTMPKVNEETRNRQGKKSKETMD